MSYIGKEPADSFISFAKQDFSTSATTSYTLDNAVVNENELALFINFVRQEPTTAYTASGTTLTLTSATASTDDMYCVYLGQAKQTVNAPDGSVGTAQLADSAVTPAKLNLNDGVTITTADNTDTLTLVSTDTDANYGPNIEMSRPVTGANSDLLGRIDFSGQDSAGNTHNYASMEAIIATATSGSEDGRFMIRSEVAGATKNMFDINGSSFVFNQDGVDYDFRVETDVQTHGIFMEGSSGNTFIGTSSGSIGNVGFKVFGTDDSTNKSGVNIVAAGGNTPCSLNRSTGDGDLMSFRSENTQEGTIAVSGTTVSYNGFTGTHWSRFTDNSTPSILKGTVLETLDEMVDWYNLEFDVTENGQTWKEKIPHVLADGEAVGDIVTYNFEGKDYQATIVKEDDIKHMKSKVSDTVDAKNVYGVFNDYEQGDEGYNDFLVASVGSFVVRIKSGQTIAKGDLLQSNGDGTAKVQTDDNVKSSSFAKVLSTTVIETYDDGSFIVPCSLMC